MGKNLRQCDRLFKTQSNNPVHNFLFFISCIILHLLHNMHDSLKKCIFQFNILYEYFVRNASTVLGINDWNKVFQHSTFIY